MSCAVKGERNENGNQGIFRSPAGLGRRAPRQYEFGRGDRVQTDHSVSRDGSEAGDGGTWSFVIAWTPVVYKNELRLSYNVSSLAGSIKGPLQCTPEKCTVRFSGMHKRQKDAYARVQMAGIGSVSGMRIDGIPYFPNCN